MDKSAADVLVCDAKNAIFIPDEQHELTLENFPI